MRAPKILALVLLTGIIAGCATHEEHKLPDMSLAQNFVPMAVSGDKFEIESSKLALTRSHDAAVRHIAHRQAIRLFQIYGENGDNADLKKFANDTLPTIEKHHDMIEKARNNEYPAQDRLN